MMEFVDVSRLDLSAASTAQTRRRSESYGGQAAGRHLSARTRRSRCRSVEKTVPFRLCRKCGSRAGVPARRARINRSLLVTGWARRFFSFVGEQAGRLRYEFSRVWRSELVIGFDGIRFERRWK